MYTNIALFGPSRSGKDTVGTHLSNQYNYSRFAFGDEMKNLFHEIFRDIPEEPKPVDGYVNFAQACREIDPDVWLKKLLPMVDVYTSLNAPVVITDMRQPNEYKALKERGFKIIKLTIPEEERQKRVNETCVKGTELTTNNPTETFFDTFEFDFHIHNDGTIGELIRKTDTAIKYFREERIS